MTPFIFIIISHFSSNVLGNYLSISNYFNINSNKNFNKP